MKLKVQGNKSMLIQLDDKVILTSSYDGLPKGAEGEIIGADNSIDLFDILFDPKLKGFDAPVKVIRNVSSKYFDKKCCFNCQHVKEIKS